MSKRHKLPEENEKISSRKCKSRLKNALLSDDDDSREQQQDPLASWYNATAIVDTTPISSGLCFNNESAVDIFCNPGRSSSGPTILHESSSLHPASASQNAPDDNPMLYLPTDDFPVHSNVVSNDITDITAAVGTSKENTSVLCQNISDYELSFLSNDAEVAPLSSNVSSSAAISTSATETSLLHHEVVNSTYQLCTEALDFAEFSCTSQNIASNTPQYCANIAAYSGVILGQEFVIPENPLATSLCSDSGITLCQELEIPEGSLASSLLGGISSCDEVEVIPMNESYCQILEEEEDEADVFYDAECSFPVAEQQLPESDRLYKGARLSTEESLTAVMTFFHSENLSLATFGRLLQLIALHLPEDNVFPTTSHFFFKALDTDDVPVHISYFCSNCLKPRPTRVDLCDECVNPDRKVSHFVHLPLAPQLSKLLSRPGFLDELSYKDEREKKNASNIEDVYDSSAYREIVNNTLVCDPDTGFITLQWDSDGISPFDSSTYSVWPLFFVINELPPKKRFKKENMVIGAIWGGFDKPHPNIFLRPTYEEVQKLSSEGVTVSPLGEPVTKKVHVVCGTCDSPAKAKFFNQKQHSGYYSCPKCLIKGEKSDRTNDVLVFPYSDNVQPRTEENYLLHVKEAVRTKNECYGIKGATYMYYIVRNMIMSTAIDVMHTVYLGVFKQILNLLFNPNYSKEKFSLSKKTNIVNKRLSNIKLPHFVERDILSLDKLAYWKASLLRNVLLYVSVPLFCNVMDDVYLNHFQLLVAAIALLNSDSISLADIEVADQLLHNFAEDFPKLYGLRHMSFNVHLLLHLARAVRETGPAWASSCFGFEKLNGDLMHMVHGTRNLDIQILTHLSYLTDVPTKIEKLPSGPVKFFCQKISNKFRRLNINEDVSDSIYTVGKYTHDVSLHLNFLQLRGKCVHSFDRLWKDGILYVADSYKKGGRVSSYVKYIIGKEVAFGKILRFVKLSECDCAGEFFCVIQKLNVQTPFRIQKCESSTTIQHIMTCTLIDNSVHLVSVSDLHSVCFYYTIADIHYLSYHLNLVELE